jgi:flagellar assembly protein FliH
LSSESAAATVEAYSFRQLRTPAGGPVHDVADVLGAAYAQADRIRHEARVAGEAEGRATGEAELRAEMEPAVRALEEAGRQLVALQAQLTSELEADAVTLALRIAEQIIAGAIDVEPERLVDVAGLALRRIADRRDVTLIVNPADLELIKASVAQLQSELGGIEHLNVQADRRVGRGGVVANTEAGEIDATLTTALARAREIIAAELAPEGAEDIPAGQVATAEPTPEPQPQRQPQAEPEPEPEPEPLHGP